MDVHRDVIVRWVVVLPISMPPDAATIVQAVAPLELELKSNPVYERLLGIG